MAVNKYYTNNAGILTEVIAPVISAGAADAGKLPALNAQGRLDSTVMPSGIGADTASIQASEAISAGHYVNIHDVAGAFRVRRADATAIGKDAHGFAPAAIASGASGLVQFEGSNDQVTGQTPGPVYLSTNPGLGTATAPSGSGNVVQRVGFATNSTNVNLQIQPPSVLA